MEPVAWTLLQLSDTPEHLKASETIRHGTDTGSIGYANTETMNWYPGVPPTPPPVTSSPAAPPPICLGLCVLPPTLGIRDCQDSHATKPTLSALW